MKIRRTITTEQIICAAHRLQEHPKKCRRVHGHNYRIRYTITRITTNDMCLDFGDIKTKLISAIDDKYDHKIILDKKDELIQVLKNGVWEMPSVIEDMILPFTGRPTAEAIAQTILEEANEIVRDIPPFDATVVKVEVEETPGHWAIATICDDFK